MDNVNQGVPPIPNQPEIKTSNNLKFYKTLAYGFVVVSVGISIAIGGYLLGINKNKSQPIAKTSVTPVVSPTPDPTANWKTYSTNNQLDIPNSFFQEQPNLTKVDSVLSLKYSPAWKISKVGMTRFKRTYFILELNKYDPSVICRGEGPCDNSADIQLWVGYPDISTVDLDGKFWGRGFVIERKKEINLNGVKVVQAFFRADTPYPAASLYKVTSNLQVYATAEFFSAQKNTNYYNETVEEINQILSTFKFTDQNQTTDISNWKTYANFDYGFEIKYPNETAIGYIDINGGKEVLMNIPVNKGESNLIGKRFHIQIVTTQMKNGVEEPASCNSTAFFGSSPSNYALNGILFLAGDVSGAFGGTENSAIASEYCTQKNNKTYKLISEIDSQRNSKLPNLDASKESEVFNQMLSTFKFTN